MRREMSDELKSFLDAGIYRLDVDGSKVAFLDPVRVLNRSYSRFKIYPSAYYSRSFGCSTAGDESKEDKVFQVTKKRKKRRPARDLNEKEKAAEKRHQEARSLLLNAHKAFVQAKELQALLPKLVKCETCLPARKVVELDFIQLGSLWQAPLYEISLCLRKEVLDETGGHEHGENDGSAAHQLFNNLIHNVTNDDVEAEILENCYILPRRSCFYMSDLRQICNLVPAHSKDGFNFIVIDPPWENGSANQKEVYPTLPNRYFLYLPIKELAHEQGALVALWITNREKLRIFVEKDLFPAWGVREFFLCYWLKVRSDGSLIGELDLFHHRPYECVLLGYINLPNDDLKTIPSHYLGSNQVIVSIPGDYSRKPPLAELLIDLIPGPRPSKCIELLPENWWQGGPRGGMNHFISKTQPTSSRRMSDEIL